MMVLELMNNHRLWVREGTAMSLFRGLLVFLCLLQATDSVNNHLKTSTGKRVELPCEYPFEDQGPISELVLHWKSPNDTLLCAIVKQKSIHRCQPGYVFQYRPGKLSLVIEKVRREDLGNHTCSAYKQNDHSDYVTDISLEGQYIVVYTSVEF
ncbi:hypothetical protein HHUSO_G34282 [Huso huso]|uniref:Ig-like domain-containing protein n=1 Tax=Huso huso TaxID=61971 RepID=A0ABR0Y5M4_HUSHU